MSERRVVKHADVNTVSSYGFFDHPTSDEARSDCCSSLVEKLIGRTPHPEGIQKGRQPDMESRSLRDIGERNENIGIGHGSSIHEA